MSTSAAVSAAASRCCNQLGLSRRFASALSISSRSFALASASGRAGPKNFSTAAYGMKGTNTIASSIATAAAATTTTTLSSAPILANHTNNTLSEARRSMGTSNRKVIDAKNARRLKIQQKKKKNVNKPASGTDEEAPTATAAAEKNPFLQHQEWVRFQKSITVDGFQTGQTTTATVLKKSRGGKQARRKREKELARLGAYSDDGSTEKISAVAQKFPAVRFSTEETADLLQQAYAALPPRAGKRGTRNLRRQADRWKTVRKIRSDYKAQQANAHCNRMAARKYKRDRTRDTLECAVDQRADDLDYQGMILKRWAATMTASATVNANANVNASASASAGDASSSGGIA